MLVCVGICGGVHVVYQTSIMFFALVPLVSMNVPPVRISILVGLHPWVLLFEGISLVYDWFVSMRVERVGERMRRYVYIQIYIYI